MRSCLLHAYGFAPSRDTDSPLIPLRVLVFGRRAQRAPAVLVPKALRPRTNLTQHLLFNGLLMSVLTAQCASADLVPRALRPRTTQIQYLISLCVLLFGRKADSTPAVLVPRALRLRTTRTQYLVLSVSALSLGPVRFPT